jgi:hypothetical protein
MTCVFDENLPIRLSKTLDYLEGEHGIRVKHITEIVKPSTSDEDWIRLLGKDESCFVVTKDNKIKRNPAEVMAWRESGLTIIFLQDSWFDLDFWTMSWRFIKIWPNLKLKIARTYNKKSILVRIKGGIEELP